MGTYEQDDAAPEVEVEIHEQARTAIVTLRGEHDISTQSHVLDALTLAAEQSKVLVDLSECTFADTSLVNALIFANGILTKQAGRLEVVIPPEADAAERLARLTRLDEILPVHPARQ